MGTNIPRPTKRPECPPRPYRTNCPNCCAPITGPFCEYCGTRFEDSGERVIPIYANGQQIGEVFKNFQRQAHDFGHNIL